MMKKKGLGDGINFRYNLGLYMKFLKKYKHIAIALLLLILATESSYVLEKYLLKILIDKATELSTQKILLESFIATVVTVGIVYAASSIIRSVMKFAHMHYLTRLEMNLLTDVKRKFFDHIIHLDYSFHTSHRTGSLISKMVRMGGAVERLTDVFVFNFSPLILQLAVISASLIYLDWMSSVIMLLTVAAFITYSLFFQRIQEKSNVEANDAEDNEKANISDMLTNIESIKYFGKEDAAKNKFSKVSEATKQKMIKFWNYYRWFDSVQILILSAGTFFLVYLTLQGFIMGKYSLGTLVFVYTIFTMLTGNLFGFIYGVRNFYRSMADLEALFKYAKVENKIKDKKNAKEFSPKEGKVEFRNVSFTYKKRKIIQNFNLAIQKNKKVALVGHTGSGKTTLIKLLYRLYDVDSGEIIIDGENIKNFKQQSLRSGMSIVTQECILFDDTIYNNVAFSKPEAKKEEVMRAIRFAQLDKLIEKLPDRERTIVGERGIKLSGGEKQRVSIARALLADKKILVLDEATSSLDSRTESEIKKDLEKLMEAKTCIIIAHRLSTIMEADKIVVMKNGRVVQEGTHKRLIREPGEYRHLWNLQKGGYIK